MEILDCTLRDGGYYTNWDFDFKLVNEYVYHITMLIVGIIPLLLLGVVLFGDNFFLGNIVVYNIQNILDSMGGFVGIITLILIVTVFHKFYKNN